MSLRSVCVFCEETSGLSANPGILRRSAFAACQVGDDPPSLSCLSIRGFFFSHTPSRAAVVSEPKKNSRSHVSGIPFFRAVCHFSELCSELWSGIPAYLPIRLPGPTFIWSRSPGNAIEKDAKVEFETVYDDRRGKHRAVEVSGGIELERTYFPPRDGRDDRRDDRRGGGDRYYSRDDRDRAPPRRDDRGYDRDRYDDRDRGYDRRGGYDDRDRAPPRRDDRDYDRRGAFSAPQIPTPRPRLSPRPLPLRPLSS